MNDNWINIVTGSGFRGSKTDDMKVEVVYHRSYLLPDYCFKDSRRPEGPKKKKKKRKAPHEDEVKASADTPNPPSASVSTSTSIDTPMEPLTKKFKADPDASAKQEVIDAASASVKKEAVKQETSVKHEVTSTSLPLLPTVSLPQVASLPLKSPST